MELRVIFVEPGRVLDDWKTGRRPGEGPVRWAESQVTEQFGPKGCCSQKPFSGTICVLVDSCCTQVLLLGLSALRFSHCSL